MPSFSKPLPAHSIMKKEITTGELMSFGGVYRKNTLLILSQLLRATTVFKSNLIAKIT